MSQVLTSLDKSKIRLSKPRYIFGDICGSSFDKYPLIITDGYYYRDDGTYKARSITNRYKQEDFRFMSTKYRDIVNNNGENKNFSPGNLLCCIAQVSSNALKTHMLKKTSRYTGRTNNDGKRKQCLAIMDPLTQSFIAIISCGSKLRIPKNEVGILILCAGSGVISPISIICTIPLEIHEPYNRSMISKYLKKLEDIDSDVKLDDLKDKHTDRVIKGENLGLEGDLVLNMANGTYNIHPVTIGYVISPMSPLKKVNMIRDIIEIDLEVETFRKVISYIIRARYPSSQELDNNRDLLENSLRIYRALDFLGIEFYADFFLELSKII